MRVKFYKPLGKLNCVNGRGPIVVTVYFHARYIIVIIIIRINNNNNVYGTRRGYGQRLSGRLIPEHGTCNKNGKRSPSVVGNFIRTFSAVWSRAIVADRLRLTIFRLEAIRLFPCVLHGPISIFDPVVFGDLFKEQVNFFERNAN